MAREFRQYPTDAENITKTGPYEPTLIWHYGVIEIERTIGEIKDHRGWVTVVTRLTCYRNPTPASRKRLDQVVANLVNKRQAAIQFIRGTLGLGYEVEL